MANDPSLNPPAWAERARQRTDRLAGTIEFANAFVQAPADERAAAVQGWDFGVKWPYPSVARLARRSGEPASPEQRIIAALVLSALENREDARDQTIFLSNAYRSAELAGLDADQLFARVADALPEALGAPLQQFRRRDPADRALRAFGLQEVRTADGEIEIRRR